MIHYPPFFGELKPINLIQVVEVIGKVGQVAVTHRVAAASGSGNGSGDGFRNGDRLRLDGRRLFVLVLFILLLLFDVARVKFLARNFVLPLRASLAFHN